MERRLKAEAEIVEEQFSFMPGRRTTEALFALGQLLEKYGEKQNELHLVFMDLEKGDTVPRDKM